MSDTFEDKSFQQEDSTPPGSLGPQEASILPPLDIFDTSGFRRSRITYFTLFILVAYPLSNLVSTDDPAEAMKLMAKYPVVFFVATLISLGLLFALVYVAVRREGQSFKSLGFDQHRWKHVLQGLTIFIALALLAKVMKVLLTALGYPPLNELSLLTPHSPGGLLMAGSMALISGIFEETAYRGYFLTRLRNLTPQGWPAKLRWGIPVFCSAVVFGLGHTWEGVDAAVMTTVIGLALALLFLYTRSIWPVIIAHFLLNSINLFVVWP